VPKISMTMTSTISQCQILNEPITFLLDGQSYPNFSYAPVLH
jgi:hypothetical protein